MSQLSRPVLEQNASPRFDATRRAEFTSMKFYVSPAGRGLSALRTRYTTPLLVLMGMVAVILLISCANVANLLLARGAARAREFAVRTAIGASRWQLVRQSLAESAILAVAGTLGGGVFATWAIRVLVAMLERGPGNGPSAVELDLSPDLRLLVFATGICAITVLLFGLAPAWRSTNVDPQSAMKSGGRGTSEGHRFRIGKSLVVAQTALALILVVCAGLLVTTFRNVATKPMGFDPENVLFARLDFSRASVPRSQERAALVGLRTRLATMPGVQAVSAADLTPVSGSSWNDAVTAEGGRRWTSLSDRLAWFNKVDSGYFAALRTRLIAGRDFGAADGPATSKVAIVNEAMAHHFFGNQSPIGRVFYTEDMGQRGDRTTIIGVVENARYQSMRDPEEPVIYLTYLQDAPAERAPSQLVIRAASTSAAIAGVKSLAASIDPRISLTFVQFTDQIAQAVQRERMLAMLSGFFGTLALVLAMVGLYGVMAYTVARRRVEMGIRIALGAARGRVLRLVLGDVGRLLAIGIVLGSAGAFALVRLLRSLLYGIEAYDPGTLVAAIALLAAAGLVAGAIPARRAAALQPVEALRED
jgi:predicted permease